MTHLEKFIALYKEIGIELTPQECEDGFYLSMEVTHRNDDDKYQKINGYLDFGTMIYFDKEGNFMSQHFVE